MRARTDETWLGTGEQASRALPLRLRLPNPPPIFMGRERETEALAAALLRAPVVLLCGPEGVGKTALALHGIRQLPGFESELALRVELCEGPGAEDPRLQLGRALAEAQGLEPVDGSRGFEDEEGLAATVIDLADRGGWWIVLELHDPSPSLAASLLVPIARYARHSRWIITSRSFPWAAELMPQTIALGGLPDEVLAQLATTFVPSLADAQRDEAVRAAEGAVGRLIRGLATSTDETVARPPAGDLHGAGRDERLSCEAGLLRVECLGARRRYHEALAVLATLEPKDAHVQVLHESWSLYCLAATDQLEGLDRRLAAIEPRVDELPAHLRSNVGLNLAKTMSLVGRVHDAYAIARHVETPTPSTHEQVAVPLALAMERGRLDEAARLLHQLASLDAETPTLRGFEAVHRALHQLCVGELRACEETLSYWKPELEHLGEQRRLSSLLKIETRLNLLRAAPPPRTPMRLAEAEVEGLPSRCNELFELHWRVRAGQPLPAGFDTRRHAELPHYALLDDVVRVDALLVQGNAQAALELCVRVIAELDRLGWGMMSAELRHTRCDILLVLGRFRELEEAARALHERATEMSCPRLVEESLLFTALVPPSPVDWGQLEVLATAIDRAPIAARRARALLGDPSALDAVDRLVLRALRKHRGLVPSASLSSWSPHAPPEPCDQERPGWGLADDERRVWLANGRSLSLRERPQLWSILATLHDHGGAATKEQLVQALWNESEYHPLHHDNRLQVAVRKLRKLIEDEPSRPARLVTTADGYTLVGRVRRTRSLDGHEAGHGRISVDPCWTREYGSEGAAPGFREACPA